MMDTDAICPNDGECAFKPVEQPEAAPKADTGSRRTTAEKCIVAAIMNALEKRHCIVIQTGQNRAKGAGNSVGCPDLFVGRAYASGIKSDWRALEVKAIGGRVSPEQQKLVDAGLVTIVRSAQEALVAMGLE
jgi:hypothetical protein